MMIRTQLTVLLGLALILPLYAHRPVAGHPDAAHPWTLPRIEGTFQDRGYDYLDQSIVSPAGTFRIHYTLDGSDAPTYATGTVVPEYISAVALAADHSLNMMTNVLGFLPPVEDDGIDGDELDIYVQNWGGSYYGVTYFGNQAGGPSYLVIDNDYQEASYTTHGYQAMQVTVAHEIFHMVQVRYAHPSPVDKRAFIFEIASVWMEEFCYPGINDYINYVYPNFQRNTLPALNALPFGTYAYGHGIFGQVLDAEYGTRQDKHIWLDIWETLGEREVANAAERVDPVLVLQDVLASSRWNSSLGDALVHYGLYNALTGSRATTEKGYADAAILPEVSIHDMPSITTTDPVPFEFMVDPLQIKTARISTQLFGDYYLTALPDADPDMQAQSAWIRYGNGIEILGQVRPDLWLPLGGMTSLDGIVVPIANGSATETGELTLQVQGSLVDLPTAIQRVFPNPLSQSETHPLSVDFIQAQAGITLLRLYDIRGREILRERAFYAEGLHLIQPVLPDHLPAGLYIITIRTGGKLISEKILILP